MNMQHYFCKQRLVCLVSVLVSSSTFAYHLPNIWNFPLPPRVSLLGTSGSRTFATADAMLPVWGDPNEIFFANVTGKYGDDRAWLASIGAGGRIIVCDTLLGAYFFTDFNKTLNANHFTVLNPGIELMTNEWDGHLNGYLPIGKKQKLLDILTSNTTFFSGHAQYTPLFDLIEEVGPGADVEAGYTFAALMRTRVFAGGYYFNPKYTSNIKGIEGGIEFPLRYKWASAELRDSYDNVRHNTFALTLKLTFGGLDKTAAPDIHDRMLDMIPRHLGSLDAGDGIPSQKTIVNKGRRVLLLDNIWFFNPEDTFAVYDDPTTLQNCTFEHPCFGLDQTRINEINVLAPNANFYLSPGIYNNPTVGTAFSFHNGQSVFGRTTDFSQPATGNGRPLLNDSLFLEGNNTVSDVRIDGHSNRNLETGGDLILFQVGVLLRSIAAPGVVNINNSEIMANSLFALNAMGVANNSTVATLNITNSAIFSSQTDIPGSIAIGAGNLRTGNFNLNNSSISVTNNDVTNNFSLAFGVVNNEAGLVNIMNSSLAVNMTHGGLATGVLNNSSLGLGLGTINITGSNIMVTTDDVGLTTGVINQANNPDGVSANVNIDQSAIAVTANNNVAGFAAGVLTMGTGVMSVNHTAINVAGNSGTLTGLVVGDPSATMNFQNTIINLNVSDTAFGAPIFNSGTLNDLGNNQCFQNGVLVPCV